MSRIILISVALGIIAGRLGIGAGHEVLLSKTGVFALNAMVFLVGISLGANKEAGERLRTVGFKAILPPLAVALGSIIGAALAGVALKMNVFEAMAVGAGFGWYSFSGVILHQMVGAQLGAIAFLSNVFRELLAVVSIPFVRKKFGKLAAIAPGGATSMDTTLPIISREAGLEIAALGFLSGAILSAIVPLLVPALARLII